MEADVTVVITSCNRFELLAKTLQSFFAYNTYAGIKEIIIFEDSEHYPDILETIDSPIPIRVIFLGINLGHLLAIDIAYSHVTTELIFHCEDDWEFYHRGFIEYSKAILETNPQVLQVHLRELSCYIVKEEHIHRSKKFAFVSSNYDWLGFSLNPGLRRLSDYRRLTSFSRQLEGKKLPIPFEQYLGHIYAQLGYVTCVLLLNDGKGFVRHIGEGKHVLDPKQILYI